MKMTLSIASYHLPSMPVHNCMQMMQYSDIAKYGHEQAHMITLYFTTMISVYSAKFLFICGDLNKPLQLS